MRGMPVRTANWSGVLIKNETHVQDRFGVYMGFFVPLTPNQPPIRKGDIIK